MRFRRGKRKSRVCDPNAGLWAILSIGVFPFVALSLSAIGIHPLIGFAGGMGSSLLVLLIERIVRGKCWFTDPCLASIISQPEFMFRMVVFVGIVMLLFQTFLFTGFLTSASLDRNVVSFILERQCVRPSDKFFAKICGTFATPKDPSIDLISTAIRKEAEARYFPNDGSVTCAAKPLIQRMDESACTHTAIVRCDRWTVGSFIKKPLSIQSIRAIVAVKLSYRPDGMYDIVSWSDNPSSQEWSTITGNIAEPALNVSDMMLDHNDAERELMIETYRRAVELFSGN